MSEFEVVERDGAVVSGADAATYLHGQASQDIAAMAVGDSRWTFLLAPTGKVDVLARVTRLDDGRFLFDTDAGFGDLLVARLNRFKIRVDVDVAPTPVRVAVGIGAAPGGTMLADWGGDPADGLVHVLVDESAPLGDAGVVEGSRIAAGWPAMGREIVPGETIPAETGLIGVAVALGKGCYPGQELVERMDSRGATARQLLRRVTVEPGTAPGGPIVVDGEVVGTVTSVAGADALGYVRREHG